MTGKTTLELRAAFLAAREAYVTRLVETGASTDAIAKEINVMTAEAPAAFTLSDAMKFAIREALK